MSARVIAVEGIDGAGKSHLCGLLTQRLARRNVRVRFLTKHDLALENDFAGRRMAELRAIIWPAEAEPPCDPLGTHFYLYLLAAWFAGLARLTKDLAERYDLILTDGSFYRVVAKAHARAGLDLDWLLGLFDHALRPDQVILLDLDPADAWNRRAAFKTTEIGRWDDQQGDAASGFRTYQGSIRSALLSFARQSGWHVIDQDATTTPENVADAAEAALALLLRPPY